MKTLYKTFGAAAIFSSLFIAEEAKAKPGWDVLGNANGYTSGISCSTCHAGTPTENNVTTSYGVLFNSRVNDNNVSTASFVPLESFDSDGDGFTNGQELRQAGGNVNYAIIFPSLSLPDIISGNVSAKAVDGGAVSALSYIGTAFTGGRTLFEKPATAATTSSTFMYKFGGIQIGATATFYDENNAVIPFTPANTADGSYVVNTLPTAPAIPIGSMNITVKDDGVFDLYSTAAFQRIAKARIPAFVPVVNPASINPYATISSFAKISPTATVDNYAVVDAYAVIDNYAVVGAYAQVGSYAYIAANVDLYAGVDIYTQVTIDPYVEVLASITTPTTQTLPNSVGYISSRFAIATSQPAPSILGGINGAGAGGGATGKTTGLHCMTSGLGTQGLMFLSLMAVGGLLLRRNKAHSIN